MKGTFTDDAVFRPIKLVITIENPEDLRELWHRFVPTPAELYHIYKARRNGHPEEYAYAFRQDKATSARVWWAIDNELKLRGLRP